MQSRSPVAAVDFSPEGRWLIASAGWKWKLCTMSGAAPAWLPQLAEAIAGVRYTANDLAEPVAEQLFLNLESQLLSSKDASPLITSAREFLGADGKSAMSGPPPK